MGTPTTPSAPGLMEGSYSPSAPTPVFTEEGTAAPANADRGAMVLSKCGVSESDRSLAIMGDVSTVTELSALSDASSIAYSALQWLDKQDELIVCSDGTGAVIQRYILALFYLTLNGSEWTNCSTAGPCAVGKPWLDGSLECEWHGVECDPSNTVTKLTLKNNNLVGILPDELFDLVDLTGLSLDHNKYIGGEIPEAIGKLTKLTYIELDDNFFGGTIPDSLYTLSTLQAIDLNGNKIGGTIF
jgi:hypothetical protein